MSSSPLTRAVPGAEAQSFEQKKVHSQLGFFLFTIFAFTQLFNLTRNFFIEYFGEGVIVYATVSTFAVLVLLPVIILEYKAISWLENGKAYLSRGAQLWLLILLMLVALLTVYGITRGYTIEMVLHDTASYLVIIAFVILGSVPEFWEDAFPVLLLVTIVAVVINLIGLRDLNALLINDATDRIARELLSYKSRDALDLWPLLLLTMHRWNKRLWVYVIFAIAFFMLVLQLLFQKRLPVAEVLAFYGVFLFIMSETEKKWFVSSQSAFVKGFRRNFLILAIFLGLVAMIFIGTVIQGQLEGLLNRYAQEDFSRIDELTGMLAGFTEGEFIIGRGMGGFFQYTDEFGYTWGSYIPSEGIIGKSTLHIGIMMPFLKGGIVLLIVFYTGLILVVRRVHLYKRDNLTFAAFAILIIKHLVYLQGGYLIMSSVYDLMLIGMCTGHVLSKNILIPLVSAHNTKE